MKRRISERRINATAVLLYLKNPCNYQDDLDLLNDNETFRLPSKITVRKEIKNIIKRLHRRSEHLESLLHASTSGNEKIVVDEENED